MDAFWLASILSRFGDCGECPICCAPLEPGERAQGLESVADHDVPLGCRRCADDWPPPSPLTLSPTPPAADAAEEQNTTQPDRDGNGTAGHMSGRDDQ